jgi:hypothetical protein
MLSDLDGLLAAAKRTSNMLKSQRRLANIVNKVGVISHHALCMAIRSIGVSLYEVQVIFSHILTALQQEFKKNRKRNESNFFLKKIIKK